ncbi:Hypothetical protein, putative [Bodo saltans]|uniref:AB hydrolase-1 domain-containing protein n=1 Tax=Bodo saltans TaxID=75058 RepID=A0A0S4JG59_BODSA|nr:Hypothetical protein, putative [Bodo saltans]|eukprot:CUG88933.1 Hypothetical protein, putative [Bodo saltans]
MIIPSNNVEDWSRYLPNVEEAKINGTMFFSAGSSRTQSLSGSTPDIIQNKGKKQKKATKFAGVNSAWSSSTQLIVRIRSKCLGSSVDPKEKQPQQQQYHFKSHNHQHAQQQQQRHHHHRGHHATSADQAPQSSARSSSDGASSASHHANAGHQQPRHDDTANDGASSTATSGFLPRRLRKSIMHVQFRFPDIQLPSIPLPSLPTISLPSWIASDAQQLAEAEEHLMHGCYFRQRVVAGMNTLVAVHHTPTATLRRYRGGGDGATEIATEVDYGDVPSSLFVAAQTNQHKNNNYSTASNNDPSSPTADLFLTSPTVASRTPLQQQRAATRHTRRQSQTFQGSDGEEDERAASSTPLLSNSALVLRDAGRRAHAGGRAVEGDKQIVVLVHGFAGGSAMWAQNWESLREDGAVDVYAFDLPGFARSERDVIVETFTGPQDSIEYYCNKFAEWFEEMDFDRPVILCGHSFGAYLSSFFVSQYFANLLEKNDTNNASDASEQQPRRPPLFGKRCEDVVKHLVLADPWGIELIPREFMKKEMRHLSARDKVIGKLFYFFTPLGGLRAAGPIGPKLLPAMRPDLAEGWSGPQRDNFFHYIYHCNAQEPPSGELAFRSCVAYAGHPLIAAGPHLLQHLPRTLGLTLMYGQTTMMDAHAGYKLMEQLWRRGHRRCRWVEISNAGHQIFSENAQEFNFEMKKVIADERRRGVQPRDS